MHTLHEAERGRGGRLEQKRVVLRNYHPVGTRTWSQRAAVPEAEVEQRCQQCRHAVPDLTQVYEQHSV